MKLIKIGSAPSNNIVINNPYVSAHHANITILDNGDIYVEDLNSKNGTFVGNKQLNPNQEVPVRRGDLVQFGNSSLVWAKVPSPDNNAKYKSIINIGSNYRNDIVVNSEATSRFHATIKVTKNNKAFLFDNGSTNGTKLNGLNIAPNQATRIKRGDNIICGGEDISEQILQYLPSAFPMWAKVAAGLIGVAAIVLGCILLIPSIITGFGKIEPKDYRSSVVYLRAAYHYEVSLEDNPLNESLTFRYPSEDSDTPYKTYSATAFFIDKEGRMATNRHVAVPWSDDYRDASETEMLTQEYEEFFANQLKVSRLDLDYTNDILKSVERLRQTSLGRKLLDECNSAQELNARIARIHKSKVVIKGVIDYITVGQPGRYYTHEDEFQRCNVICESGTKDKDVAILQLNDKKTPQDIKHIIDITKPISDIVPLQNEYYSIGYPFGLTWGMDSQTKSLEPTIKATKCTKEPGRYNFQIESNTEGGSSGSPVFNRNGQLVGIISSGFMATDVTYAVHAKYLKDLYESEIGSISELDN